MAKVDTDSLISVTDASKMGVARLVKDAEEGREHVVLRSNRAVAAVVGIKRLEAIQQVEDDIADVSLAAARIMADNGRRTSLDDVLTRLGYSRADLREDAQVG